MSDGLRRYPPELREQGVRMVAEISDQHESEFEMGPRVHVEANPQATVHITGDAS